MFNVQFRDIDVKDFYRILIRHALYRGETEIADQLADIVIDIHEVEEQNRESQPVW